MTKKYTIGIIGCGLIGKKRAHALCKFPNSKIIAVADINIDSAKGLASEYKCDYTNDWKKIVSNPSINMVFIATVHNMLAPIMLEAIKNGKHVLVEKPAGVSSKELDQIIVEYNKNPQLKIKVGFNHRFHPAFDKAKALLATKEFGDIMFIRASYGHGARVGYDKEWRAKKEISGGGELVDQGSHLIDLSRYFLGDFDSVIGELGTFFWDMSVEDNAFLILKTKKGAIAQLHASWTHWKNHSNFDIFCKTAQISISGLGKSYGKETLTLFTMKPEMGPPDKKVYEFDSEDDSWEKEYQDFITAIEQGKEPNGTIYDALANWKIIEKLYNQKI